MRHIVIDTQACAGCTTCEVVCSLSHEGAISPALARLRITDYFLEGHRIEALICQQCNGAECMRICRTKATKAISVDKNTGAKIIDPELCNGCRMCMEACPKYPQAPIFFDEMSKICKKCDLCGGEPLCVKFCPEAALSISTEESTK